jgi:type II secretion system protein G
MKRLLLLTAIFLTACGPSQEEKEEIVNITCNIMGESRSMDGAVRIREINAAREKLGEDAFLGSGDAIKESLEYGLCNELVLNDPDYSQKLILTMLEKAESSEREIREKAARNAAWVKAMRVVTDIRQIEYALKFYRLDNYYYPSQSQGLEALVSVPSGSMPLWNGPYLDKLPIDPYGVQYYYSNPGTHGKQVEVYTLGLDNALGGEGPDSDRGNWNLVDRATKIPPAPSIQPSKINVNTSKPDKSDT